MPELSKPFQELARMCATCGGPMPCALHDEQLREAILHPPEREGLPWEKVERTDVLAFNAPIMAFVARQDGTWILGDSHGAVVRVDPAKSGDERTKVLHKFRVNVLAMVPGADGTLLMGVDGKVVRFDLAQDADHRAVSLWNYESPVYAIVPRPDGTFLIGGSRGRIVRFDLLLPQDEHAVEEIGALQTPVCALAQLPDSTYLIGGTRGRIFRFDPAESEGERETFMGNYPSDYINAAATLVDGSVVMGGKGGELMLASGTAADVRLESIGNFGDIITSIVPESDTSFLVSGANGIIARYALPERILRAQHEQKLGEPKVPPMPE